MKVLLFILAAFVILVAGCVQQETQGTADTAKTRCISLCEQKLGEGLDLSNGPCLSNGNPDWDISDWVCDVAHSPRQAVDNLAENQCKDFREGRARHFVEVDPSCKFIKAI